MEASAFGEAFLAESGRLTMPSKVRAEDDLQLPGHALTIAIRYLSVYRLISSIRGLGRPLEERYKETVVSGGSGTFPVIVRPSLLERAQQFGRVVATYLRNFTRR